MTNTHTPGPWEHNGYTMITGNNKILANVTMPGEFFTQIETKANARLIAAAPELLSATQGLLLWLADETIKRRLEGLDDASPVKAALAAIAKARGE